jgi:hypothetical protein
VALEMRRQAVLPQGVLQKLEAILVQVVLPQIELSRGLPQQVKLLAWEQ